MKENEMKKIALWISEVISNPKAYLMVRKQVEKFSKRFPLPK